MRRSRHPRRLTAAAAACAAALALAGCGGTSTATFGRDDRAIVVEDGQVFAIELAENPSVGDDWRLETAPDAAVVAFVGQTFEPESDQPGAGGIAAFAFEARAAGTTSIELFNCYRCLGDDRPRPENEAPSERLRFTVTVEG